MLGIFASKERRRDNRKKWDMQSGESVKGVRNIFFIISKYPLRETNKQSKEPDALQLDTRPSRTSPTNMFASCCFSPCPPKTSIQRRSICQIVESPRFDIQTVLTILVPQLPLPRGISCSPLAQRQHSWKQVARRLLRPPPPVSSFS